jgi:hypothetical protein
MLEISTDHACDAVSQHTPVGLRSPQSLLLSSTIGATGRCSPSPEVLTDWRNQRYAAGWHLVDGSR